MSKSMVRALRYEEQEVGKHIKSTKKRFLWVVAIGERVYNFILNDSVISGKSKLSINGKIFHQIEQSGLSRSKYNHSFIIDDCLFNLIEMDDNYEMRINNNLFSHLLSQQMKKASFTDHVVEDSSFDLDQKFKRTESKKITMNLPGITNSMKKKKTTPAQSDNWDVFSGGINEFSSFFDASRQQKQDIVIKKQSQNKISEEMKSVDVVINKLQNSLLVEQKCILKNVFDTRNESGAYYEKTTKQTPIYQVNQIPAISEINLMQFNTMQNLFATSHHQIVQAKAAEIQTKFDNFSFITNSPKLQIERTKFDCFNTMQNLFNTNNMDNTELKKPTSQLQKYMLKEYDNKKDKFDEFNTIHKPISTNQQHKLQKVVSQLENIKNSEKQQLQILTMSDTKDQQKSNIFQMNQTKIDFSDFNTMQKLFMTNFPQGAENVLNSKMSNVITGQQTETKNMSFSYLNTNQKDNEACGQKKENIFWQF